MRIRESRACFRCDQKFSHLFRCKINTSDNWIFLCEDCLENSKKESIFYQYGGTWKAKKKK